MENSSVNKNIVVLSKFNANKTLLSKYFNNKMFVDKNISFSIFDYRKIKLDGQETYLLNSPDDNDFKSLNSLFDESLDGIIIFIETTAGLEDTDLEIMDLIKSKNTPHILMANRNDLNDIEMNISVEGVLIVPTIIEEEIGVDSGLKMLLKLINNNNANNKKNESISQKNAKKSTSEFCKVRLFFHPIEIDNVKKSLEKFGFSNLTLIDIKYQDKNIENTETYRCSSYEMKLPSKTEMMMIIKKEEIQYLVKAIEAVKTEDISEKIFFSPVEDVIRIRTTERGENAVD